MSGDECALIEKARRALRSAEILMKDGDVDAAASRGYYAMFYCATALLNRKGLTFSSHAAVTSAFGKEFAKTGDLPAEYHRWFIDAEVVRTRGDYSTPSLISEETASIIISRARQFLANTEAYLSRA